jgi:hypothetical protein
VGYAPNKTPSYIGCFICDLGNLNGMKKNQTVPIWHSKMVLALHFAHFVEVSKGHNKT